MASSAFRRLFHWGPIAALAIIKLITWTMVHHIGMWWPPHSSLGAMINATSFLSFAAATLYYFLQSFLEGPGFVPLGWKPAKEEDVEYLQFCITCDGYKPPRSHHCSKCGQCVMKMDHHCPWINSCVGHANHFYFTAFLVYAVIGCFHASVVLTICLYHALNRVAYLRSGVGREPIVHLTLNSLVVSLLAIGMALGVVLAVGTLLFFQFRGILRNRTNIEEWIEDKASYRRRERGLPPLLFPYDLGWRLNLNVVWRSNRYDGIHWPVRAGCGQYDLTMEQKEQKKEKRLRSIVVEVVSPYSGSWLPLGGYTRAALAPPCSDAPRLRLRPGDLLAVTRQRRHWYFGEKLVGAGEPPCAGAGPSPRAGPAPGPAPRARAPRGWFPRACAVAVCARGAGPGAGEHDALLKHKAE